MSRLADGAILGVLTLLTAWGDSRGFICASRAWVQGNPQWSNIWLSAAWFTAGVLFYLLALKYLLQLRDVGPSVQTLGWFLVTIVAVAIGSRDFFRWQIVDQVLALSSAVALAAVIIRTGR